MDLNTKLRLLRAGGHWVKRGKYKLKVKRGKRGKYKPKDALQKEIDSFYKKT